MAHPSSTITHATELATQYYLVFEVSLFIAQSMYLHYNDLGFLGGSDGKESSCNARDPGLIPGSGRFPGEGNGYPLQCSCLENSMGRGAWQTIVHEVAESQTWVSWYFIIIFHYNNLIFLNYSFLYTNVLLVKAIFYHSYILQTAPGWYCIYCFVDAG